MSHELPFGYLSDPHIGVWTDRSGGNLIVNSGITTLTSGQIYHYNEVYVAAGATLRLSAGANITQISANRITIDGTLDARYGEHRGATYFATSPFEGRSYSHTSNQNRGGRVWAQRSGSNINTSWQGNGAYGNGSACRFDLNASNGNNGNFVILNPSTTRGGGDGGYVYSGNGTNTSRSGTLIQGGGGARGRHGQGLVLNSKRILGSGQILANGSNGGAGTTGSFTISYSSDYCIPLSLSGWLPGGSGAGGNGGKVWFEYTHEYSTTLWNNINIEAGSGGPQRGWYGSTSGCNHRFIGEPGLNGNSGGKVLTDLREL